MSHILDALQKVQEEKAAKLKQTAITGGVLLDAPTAKKTRSNRFLLVGGIVACLLITALVVQWYQKPAPRSQAGLPSAPLPLQQSQPPESAALPASQPQTGADARQPAAAPVTPPTAPTPAPAPLAAAPAAPVAATAQANREEDHEERPVSRRSQQKTTAPPPAAATQERVVQTGTPEGIKLSGIAWQESRKMRRAVVNDVLAGENTVIAGARIVEIKPQAVLFEKNGMLYEVVLPR